MDPLTAVRQIQQDLWAIDLGGLSPDTTFNRGKGYTLVCRTDAWLAMRTMHPSLDVPDQTRAYLETFLTHQPSTQLAGHEGQLDMRIVGTPLNLFGPNGLLKAAFDSFQNRPFVDADAILWILKVILREAMNVVDTFNYFMNVLGERISPSYRWYLAALRECYWSFQKMILDPFNGVLYRVRERFKHVPFLHLWDR